MIDEVCEGCGVPLQSEHPDAPGYVPTHVMRRTEPVVCRRCFRISHYGQEELGAAPNAENAWSTVLDVVASVDVCIMVIDVLDFEGSFIRLLAEHAGERLLIAANKVDLLPSKTPVDEVVQWIESRLSGEGLRCSGVHGVSARSGYGVRVLLDAARRRAGKGGKVGLVGATNVGKSTLVNRWIKSSSDPVSTVSRYPGTTVGVVERELDGLGLEVMDTPGLNTRGRVTDIVCGTCAARMVPETPLTSKLIRLTPGHGVVMGGLAAFVPRAYPSGEQLVLAFAAGEVPVVKVKEEKIGAWLGGNVPGTEDFLCGACRKKLGQIGREEVVTCVDEMEDVAVHGLGWLSPRRSGLEMRVIVPSGAMVTTRPRLIGPKTRYGESSGEQPE